MTMLIDPPEVRPRVMSTMGLAGDTKLEWDGNNPVETRNARETFEKLTSENFTAFAEDAGGARRRITSFDETADKIVLVPGGMAAG